MLMLLFSEFIPYLERMELPATRKLCQIGKVWHTCNKKGIFCPGCVTHLVRALSECQKGHGFYYHSRHTLCYGFDPRVGLIQGSYNQCFSLTLFPSSLQNQKNSLRRIKNKQANKWKSDIFPLFLLYFSENWSTYRIRIHGVERRKKIHLCSNRPCVTPYKITKFG